MGQNITKYRNAGNQGHIDIGDRCRIQFVSKFESHLHYKKFLIGFSFEPY